MPTARGNLLKIGFELEVFDFKYFLPSVYSFQRFFSRFTIELKRAVETRAKSTINGNLMIRSWSKRDLIEYPL
jgi:hypothetical protein